MNDQQKINIIAKFMGYKYIQENVFIEGDHGIYEPDEVTTVYSKVPIEVVKYEDDENYYFKDLPNPDFNLEKSIKGFRTDWETLSWDTLNGREYIIHPGYLTDWNRIMEVINKIENVHHCQNPIVHIASYYCEIDCKSGNYGKQFINFDTNKINATINSILQFIEYYNTQTNG